MRWRMPAIWTGCWQHDSAGPVTVAALQYCAAGTSQETLAFLLPMIAEAAEQGAGLVSLPEAATFLAGSRRALEKEAEDEGESPTLDALRGCAARHGIDLHAGSLFLRRGDGRLVNRAVMIGADGSVRAQYDKIHMFDANVGDGKRYRESDYFAAGDRMVMTDAAGWQLGLSICYDLRFPHLYRELGLAGAEMIMVPAAFTYPSGRAHWHVLLRAAPSRPAVSWSRRHSAPMRMAAHLWPCADHFALGQGSGGGADR